MHRKGSFQPVCYLWGKVINSLEEWFGGDTHRFSLHSAPRQKAEICEGGRCKCCHHIFQGVRSVAGARGSRSPNRVTLDMGSKATRAAFPYLRKSRNRLVVFQAGLNLNTQTVYLNVSGNQKIKRESKTNASKGCVFGHRAEWTQSTVRTPDYGPHAALRKEWQLSHWTTVG